MNTQEIEHILVTPTSEIVLRKEEISTLDVFYIPQLKVVVKIHRKKIKLESTTITTLGNELMDVLWKDPSTDPSANLIRLSQFAGAYSTTTIDKETKVQLLLK